MGPLHPPKVLLWQTQAGGCNSQQLVPQDLPLLVPAMILASATDTNLILNEAPVPSTIPTILHGDSTGNGRTPCSPTLSYKHLTTHEYSGVPTHPVTLDLPLPEQYYFPS